MKKLMNKKGFTLMEMLIVVAIIVILVAISIPTFSSQLDNAKKATDDANLRAAKGIAQTREMMDGWGEFDTTPDDNAGYTGTLYYDIDNGVFKTGTPSTNYGQSSDHTGEYIVVKITNGTLDSGYPMWSGDVPTGDGQS